MAPADALAVCVGCGATAPVASAAPPPHCRRCGFDIEAPAPRVLRYEGDDARPYEELQAFANELGAPGTGKCASLTFSCDGLLFEASLAFDSGVVTGLDLVVRTNGLPPMRIVSRGASFETQTTADPRAVGYALSSAAVRAAVTELVAIGSLSIDETKVALTARASTNPFGRDRLRRLVYALRTIGGAPRLLMAPRAKPIELSMPVVCAAMLIPSTVCALLFGFVRYAPFDPTSKLLLLPGAAIALLFVRRPVVRVLTTICLPPLVFGLLLTLNGACDGSAERMEQMHVTSSRRHELLVDVFAVDDHGISHAFSFERGAFSPGDTIDVPMRSGALGWRWQSRSEMLVTHR